MASEYTYDEGNETWPFFAVALLSFILIPLTIAWVLQIVKKDDPSGKNKQTKGAIVETSSSLGLPYSKIQEAFQRSKSPSKVFNLTFVIIVLGWSAVIYIALNFVSEADLKGVFDPYIILDVSRMASEREIKTRYKKLSLKFHPDKIAKDLTDAAREKLEADFIKINLAYKALTDEVTKENFLKYGHPDGPQDVSHGIAIPKLLVEGKFSPIVIAFYFILIGVLLPYIVGSWWNSVKAYTRKGLHVDTAAEFARKLADRHPSKLLTERDILWWLIESEEIKKLISGLSIKQVNDLVSEHFRGETNEDHSLELKKAQILAALPKLIDNFIEIAIVFRQYDVLISACDLRKSIFQGVKLNGKYKELLQLPFVDANAISSQDVKTLGKLLTLDDEKVSKVLGIEDKGRLEIAKKVASHIPQLRIIEAEFHVPGEETVPPSSNAHLSVKFLVKSPKLKSCPEISEERLKEEETLLTLRDPYASNSLQPELPYAFTPRFPDFARTSWTAFLINQKENKIVEGSSPQELTHADLSNVELTQEEWEKSEEGVVTISSFKIPLPTAVPPNEGTFYFRLIMKNNTYFGCDVDIPVDLHVKSPPMVLTKKSETNESDDESDISDPEEDSIAGALAALRGDNVKKSIESDTEGEDEDNDDFDFDSDFTDINTDTEDEAD